MFKRQLLFFSLLIFSAFNSMSGICYAQTSMAAPDTMRLTLQEAERIFLDSNLQLLASHYSINSAEALVQQAKKWDNPTLITDQNVYSNKKFFHHGVDENGNNDGQVFIQVQQLIKTAGKRGKQVALAKTNVKMAELQFRKVLRDLRAILVQDFYTIAQLKDNAALLSDNIARVSQLQIAMENQFRSGNIAQKEYLRVQALGISLAHDLNENATQLNDAESELKSLLQITGNVFISPIADNSEPAVEPAIPLVQLVDSARNNNVDYISEVLSLNYNRQNLSLQKALAVPDVTVGPEYDQSSNYTSNYYGLTLSLPIPLFDRNRGNIRSANFDVKKEEASLRLAETKLRNDVLNAYQKLLMAIKLSSTSNATFYSDYYRLYGNIIESYNKRQIGMIEFLEYFNDYQEVRKNQLKQTLSLRLAKQELNDVVGATVAR